MALSRRLLLRSCGAAAITVAGALCLAGCSDDPAGPGAQTRIPDDWTREVMEPLTISLPVGMSAFVQESGSTSFY